MLLSAQLAGSGLFHVPLRTSLGSTGANVVRYLSVNSAITSGIRKGRDFGERKRSPRSNDRESGFNDAFTTKRSPWQQRGRTSSGPARPRFQDSDEVRDRFPTRRRDSGDAPVEHRAPSRWNRNDGPDSHRSGRMASGRADRSFGGRRTETSNKYRSTRQHADNREDEVSLRKNRYEAMPRTNKHGDRDETGTYQRQNNINFRHEDDQPGVGPTLSRKVYLVPPHHIPYTSPVAEFIYGTSAVTAAVRCGRRKLYTLYLYEEASEMPSKEPKWENSQIRSIAKYASLAGAKVKHVTGPWKATLDKMTGKRPHNGLVLEASPLPKPPVLNLQNVLSKSNTHFLANLAPQPEEQAIVNGTNGHIPFEARRKGAEASRYPFVLLLDGILDPGNLGAIFRSAHWFGVDAVAFSPLSSAPISPIVMKASSGATETIPMLAIRDVSAFLTASHANGWKFFAADAPNAAHVNDYTRKIPVMGNLEVLSAELQKAPCVLMLGGEGSGLQQKIKNRADAFVTIPGAYSSNIQDDIAGVSSLNVSVASAILCEAFLARQPSAGFTEAPGEDETNVDSNRVF